VTRCWVTRRFRTHLGLRAGGGGKYNSRLEEIPCEELHDLELTENTVRAIRRGTTGCADFCLGTEDMDISLVGKSRGKRLFEKSKCR
jgi:hypothetical protein